MQKQLLPRSSKSYNNTSMLLKQKNKSTVSILTYGHDMEHWISFTVVSWAVSMALTTAYFYTSVNTCSAVFNARSLHFGQFNSNDCFCNVLPHCSVPSQQSTLTWFSMLSCTRRKEQPSDKLFQTSILELRQITSF